MFHRRGVPPLAVCALCVSAAAFTQSDDTAVPKEIAVPSGHKKLLTVVAKGAQIYKAAEAPDGKLSWVFEAPLANLFDDQGALVGYHFEGPSWEASDGSKVVRDGSEPVKSAPAPNPQKDIPWLLIKVKADKGEAGKFTPAVYIQRIQTSGGKEPASAPKRAGTRVGVLYTARYVLYAKD
jgi:Protein of unknown function (DUF3455)